jgi:hypothetical protein
MIVDLALCHPDRDPAANPRPCEHRSVAKEGRIVCGRITEGDNEVSPSVCQACPFMAVNCGHLRFSLCQTSPSPIIVRFNGHTEVWDDKPPELQFHRAACAAKVVPIEHPGTCAECALRIPVRVPSEATDPRSRRVNKPGKVVPFPERNVAAAAG